MRAAIQPLTPVFTAAETSEVPSDERRLRDDLLFSYFPWCLDGRGSSLALTWTEGQRGRSDEEDAILAALGRGVWGAHVVVGGEGPEHDLIDLVDRRRFRGIVDGHPRLRAGAVVGGIRVTMPGPAVVVGAWPILPPERSEEFINAVQVLLSGDLPLKPDLARTMVMTTLLDALGLGFGDADSDPPWAAIERHAREVVARWMLRVPDPSRDDALERRGGVVDGIQDSVFDDILAAWCAYDWRPDESPCEGWLPGMSAAEALLADEAGELEGRGLHEEARALLRSVSRGVFGLHLVRRVEGMSMLLLDLADGSTREVARHAGIEPASVIAGRLIDVDGRPEILAPINLGNRFRGRIEAALAAGQPASGDAAWALADELIVERFGEDSDDDDDDDGEENGCSMRIRDGALARERARELARGRDGWSHEMSTEIDGIRNTQFWWWPPASTGLDPDRPRRITVERELVEVEAFDPADGARLLPIAAELFAGIGTDARLFRLTNEKLLEGLRASARGELPVDLDSGG